MSRRSERARLRTASEHRVMSRFGISRLRLFGLLAFVALIAFAGGFRIGLTTPLAHYQSVSLISSEINSPLPGPAQLRQVLLHADGWLYWRTTGAYQKARLEESSVVALFADLNRQSPAWAESYPHGGGGTREEVLVLGEGERYIHVQDPITNLAVPDSLRSALAVLHRWTSPNTPGEPLKVDALRLLAVPYTSAPDGPVYDPPQALDMPAAIGGVTLQGAKLEELLSEWGPIDNFQELNWRLVRVPDGSLYRVYWNMDWSLVQG